MVPSEAIEKEVRSGIQKYYPIFKEMRPERFLLFFFFLTDKNPITEKS